MSNMVSFDICEGKPGALQFLMQAYQANPFGAEAMFRNFRDNGVTGSKLYMFWNDCCGRDTQMAMSIGRNRPIEEIIQHINYEEGRGIPFEREEENA